MLRMKEWRCLDPCWSRSFELTALERTEYKMPRENITCKRFRAGLPTVANFKSIDCFSVAKRGTSH